MRLVHVSGRGQVEGSGETHSPDLSSDWDPLYNFALNGWKLSGTSCPRWLPAPMLTCGTHWGRCHALEGIRLLIEKESITGDICSGLWVDLWTVDKFTGNRTWLWLCRSWTFCSEELKGTRTNTAERTGARWGCWLGSANLQLQPVLTREAECVLCFIVRVF